MSRELNKRQEAEEAQEEEASPREDKTWTKTRKSLSLGLATSILCFFEAKSQAKESVKGLVKGFLC